MAAIGAILSRTSQEVQQQSVDSMCAGLRRYGPDVAGTVRDGVVGGVWAGDLGFTPQESIERQPIALGGGQWLLFAGRLDHREDLCAALGMPRESAILRADGDIARLAWDRWQEDLTSYLFGSYSVIIIDAARRRLLALRSPLRAPPLHYHDKPDRFSIASMPSGLFALSDIRRELNDQRIADGLVLNFEDRSATVFKGINSLPLGHMLTVTPASLTITNLYDIRHTTPIILRRDDDYIEQANALLDAAVSSAMRSVTTPGITLSSGLDSPSVAMAALNHVGRTGGGRLRAFVSVPDPAWDGRVIGAGCAGDESGPVRILAGHYPALDVAFIDSANIPLDAGLDVFQRCADMPTRSVGNLHWSSDLAHHMHAEGIRVALSGSSGNATISATGADSYLSGLFRQGRWTRLAQEVRKGNQATGQTRLLGLSGLFGSAILPNLPHAINVAYSRFRSRGAHAGWRVWSAITPEFARDMRVDERMAEFGWDDDRIAPRDRRQRMALMLDRGNRHQAGTTLLAWQAAFGIEERDPLCDRHLAEFCYAIPDDQFYRGGVDRRLVRQIMAHRLPSAILQAPRGRQGSDWALRLRRDVDRFDAELLQFAKDPDIAYRIDIPRLRAALHNMPGHTPLNTQEHPDLMIAMLGFGRALSVGRFLQNAKADSKGG